MKMNSHPIIPAEKVVEYLQTVDNVHAMNPEWRKGQTYMNVLFDMYPDIYHYITGTEYDPFYVDDRIFGFLAEIC